MKNSIFSTVFTCLLAVLFTTNVAFSQTATTAWKMGGNTFTAASMSGDWWLGTKAAYPLKFKVNSIEKMRLAPTGQSNLIIGGTTSQISDPNVFTQLDIQSPTVTYGARFGAVAKTSTSGGSASGTAEGRLAQCNNWSAGGAVTAVAGYSTVTNLNTSYSNSIGAGGTFGVSLAGASLTSNPGNQVQVSGVGGYLSGAPASYPQNGFVTAVAGVDNINNANTWAAYFVGKTYCSAGVWTSSDRRFKKDIHQIDGALAIVNRLSGTRYEFDQEKFTDRNFAAGKTLGFIAQDLREVLPELVNEGADGYLSIKYEGMIPVLNEAIKELKSEKDTEIAVMQTQILEKDRQIENLEARLAKLEMLIANLPAKSENRSSQNFETPAKSSFQIFPNPASGFVNLTFSEKNGTDQTVQIMDSTGKILKTTTVNVAEQTTLDLRDLPQGIYSVKVGSGAAQQLTKF